MVKGAIGLAGDQASPPAFGSWQMALDYLDHARRRGAQVHILDASGVWAEDVRNRAGRTVRFSHNGAVTVNPLATAGTLGTGYGFHDQVADYLALIGTAPDRYPTPALTKVLARMLLERLGERGFADLTIRDCLEFLDERIAADGRFKASRSRFAGLSVTHDVPSVLRTDDTSVELGDDDDVLHWDLSALRSRAAAPGSPEIAMAGALLHTLIGIGDQSPAMGPRLLIVDGGSAWRGIRCEILTALMRQARIGGNEVLVHLRNHIPDRDMRGFLDHVVAEARAHVPAPSVRADGSEIYFRTPKTIFGFATTPDLRRCE